jgi:hypothetical protein
MVTTFRTSSLADIPSLSESDWGSAFDPGSMIDTMTVAGPGSSLTANDDTSARRVLNQLYTSSILP